MPAGERNGHGASQVLVDDGHVDGAEGGELNSSVARAVVRIYRTICGRGPTKARAMYRGDVLVVVLEDVLTPAERSLVATGRAEAVLELRSKLHTAMRGLLASAVNELTGAEVRAVIGATECDPDVASELFLLDRPVRPSDGPPPHRT
jgi:uncharacterized protein YbcI